MNEDYRYKGLRKRLRDELEKKGINDQDVLKAINLVPRHRFMDSSFIKFSYSDQAFPIGNQQTISQPYTVAFQTELLEVKPLHRVLEVGTGSGYQAAVLAEMGARVYTIERHRDLFLRARALLTELGYNIEFFYGDGYMGVPSYAPFDKILITAGAPEVPKELYKQLKIGGTMVIPVGGTSGQKMLKISKTEEEKYEHSEHGSFIFVPMVKGKDS
ncbi:MAG: protein-L-isoaspartate(D-aspartate) O-methyltransferase [Bacteroidota bacterium]